MSQLFIKNEQTKENNIFFLETYSPLKNPEESFRNNTSFCENFKEENFFFNNSEFPKMNQDNTFQNTNSFLINNNDTLYHSPSSNSLKNISSKNLISTIPEMDNKNNKNKEIDQKHIMNKISARKSRQKKKEYIKNLEEEILKLKNEISLNKNTNISSIIDSINENDKKNKHFFNNIILFEKHVKEIKKEGQKKKANLISEYELLQKDILKEMLIRLVKYFIPLKYQIFGEKYIKLIDISEDDSISVVITKINENLNRINYYMDNSKNVRIKFVNKFYQQYKTLKNFVENFQQMFNESLI